MKKNVGWVRNSRSDESPIVNIRGGNSKSSFMEPGTSMEIVQYLRKHVGYALFVLFCLFISGGFNKIALGQAYVTPWGNLKGIRIDGQLMKFNTSLCAAGSGWSDLTQTAKERQRPKYTRENGKQMISTGLGTLDFMESIEDTGRGLARIDVKVTAKSDTNIAGAWFRIDLPADKYSGGTIRLSGQPASVDSQISLAAGHTGNKNGYLNTTVRSVRFVSADRQLAVTFTRPTQIIVKNNSDETAPRSDIRVYITLVSGNVAQGRSVEKTFTLEAGGKPDKRPVTLTLNTSQPGRKFAGIGGNFRLQNPKVDPEVIKYNLNHLRVAWGRVELPWYLWQPKENVDPIAEAKAGKLNPRVRAAMEMAQKLSKRGIPVILSAWFPPAWAVQGKVHFRPVNGVWGNALNPDKIQEIYKSIGDYIAYLKEHYGVEVSMFSFNESDLGINVRQTGREHDRLIKGLGAYLVSRGLKTKLLLGDTSDANAFDFIKPAMADPAARPYMGAVDFHAWRGWADTTLNKWATAAKKLNLPLIVAEGGINAAAYRNPDIFTQPDFALHETNIYLRILKICQPLAILQWQLTSDYSLLAGGGVYGNNDEPLHPTRRFWDMKQLASTPKDALFMPITSNRSDVTCVALGENDKGIYTIHLLNNGTTRQVTLTGLPDGVKKLNIYVTDSKRNMKEGKPVNVSNGKARFTLDATSFTTLTTTPL